MPANNFKCDVCGEFIPHDDLLAETARHDLVSPSSHLSEEEYETYCANHNACNCDICHRHKRYQYVLSILDSLPLEGVDKVKRFLVKCYSDLNNVEMDNNVNQSIIEGSWPTADENIKCARKRYANRNN